MSRATQMERIISKGQLVGLTFTHDAVAASQTDVQLNLIEAGANVLAVTEQIAPWEGEIIGISVLAEGSAATAGSLAVGPTINGTERAGLTQTLTTGKEATARAVRGAHPFNAGDNIGAEITTSADWDGTALDLVVTVWVLLHLEGI